MSHEDFKKKVPIDPNDLMWTHLELLRKCKFVAVVQNKIPPRQGAKPVSLNFFIRTIEVSKRSEYLWECGVCSLKFNE